jgi:ABC-2 type transport system permease protein
MTPSSLNRPRRSPSEALNWLLPVVVRPRLLSLKNRYFRGGVSLSCLLSTALTAGMMVGLYLCCTHAIRELSRTTAAGSMAMTLLSGSLGALFMLVTVSSAVSAISSLYLSRDIELLLSSPLPPRSLLRGKTVDVGISAAWIAVVFSIPLYVAFGASLNAHWIYFVVAPCLVAMLLLCAVLLGIALSIVFLALIPATLGRIFLGVLFLLALSVLLQTLHLVPTTFAPKRTDGSSMAMHVYTWLHQEYCPTFWVSRAVESLCKGSLTLASTVCTILATSAWVLWHSVCFAFTRLHHATYSKLLSRRKYRGFMSATLGRFRSALPCPTWLQPLRGLITREFFSFTRDLSHTAQLGMLLTISLLYLYNLKAVEPPTHVDTTILRLWDICLVFSSIALSSIILLSICTRFVFPSISLEGQTFWLLQASPLTHREILRAKYWAWFIPLAVISAIIFSAGGLSLGLDLVIVLSLVIIGVIFCHGLVALGIGFGARCARFDWEHPTELATSWGSLVFTISALLLLTVSMIPVALMIGLYLFFPEPFRHSNNLLTLLSIGFGSLWLLHFTVGRLGLRLGVRALDRIRHS